MQRQLYEARLSQESIALKRYQRQGLGNYRWTKLLKHVHRTILNYYYQLLQYLLWLFLPITILFIKWNKYDKLFR